jgi:large subunit ribosomal protein L25
MITDTVIQATPREELGKNAARRVRAAGRIPVAVYGEGLDAVAASVEARAFGTLLRSEAGRHAIFTLAVDGLDSATVKIHRMDLHPITNRLVHMDLMRISLTEKTQVAVPLEFVGEAAGVRDEDGILEVHLHEIQIECLPRDIPTNLQVDVSNLGIGDQMHVRDIPVDPDAITVATDGDHLVVAVIAPRRAEEPTDETEGAASPAEPPAGE